MRGTAARWSGAYPASNGKAAEGDPPALALGAGAGRPYRARQGG
jgi:hypothetical protein